jgi:hypothetical protein
MASCQELQDGAVIFLLKSIVASLAAVFTSLVRYCWHLHQDNKVCIAHFLVNNLIDLKKQTGYPLQTSSKE